MRTYIELTLEERVEMQQRPASGDSLRAIARSLGRSPNTISRECHRSSAGGAGYRAKAAQQHSLAHRKKLRVTRKLDDVALWEAVQALLRARWSPEQIAGILARDFPDAASYRVSQKTIYSAIYLGTARRVAQRTERLSAPGPKHAQATHTWC